MEKCRKLFLKYWDQYYEVITYLIVGGLTTVLNIAVYTILSQLGLSTGIANGIAWALSVLAAYPLNRRWVFHSSSKGAALGKEFASFVGCRVGTGVLDQCIMIAGVDILGPKIIAPAHIKLWGFGVKVLSNVLVIILNYVFSKWLIFKKDKK